MGLFSSYLQTNIPLNGRKMENWFDMIEVGEVDAAKKVLFQ